jgi:hypothetical protein
MMVGRSFVISSLKIERDRLKKSLKDTRIVQVPEDWVASILADIYLGTSYSYYSKFSLHKIREISFPQIQELAVHQL